MSRWYRTAPFAADHTDRRIEKWEYRRASGDVQTFDVDVRVGKPLDVVKLKGTGLAEVREYAAFLAASAQQLYGESTALQRNATCPICGTSLDGARIELQVFGIPYVRCPACAHVLVEGQPTAAALARVFADSDEHSAIYVDRAALETRMEQIIAPKLDWCLDVYAQSGRGTPVRIVDVGAGGGHFLAGASRRGFVVEGFEKSRTSRAFAKEAFDLTLRTEDFTTTSLSPVDLLTFWGLLEYVQRPRDFIAAARRALAPGGLLVVEVPRADALGTIVQADEGAVVARHMDPTTHVNAFSDESLCTALVEEGFGPVAAWYFGMDAWEFVVQAALRIGDDALLGQLAEGIPALQRAADRGRQCDDIVIAARLLAN